MNDESNFYFVKIIVDVLIFLEFSDESVVDPDAAIQVTEQMAAELQSMDEVARKYFCARLKLLATAYSGEKCDFVNGLHDLLGLN